MTGKTSFLLALSALALAGSAEAARWVVPAAAHAAGAAGTNWRTDLRIGNPTGSPLSATVTLLPANTDNSALAGGVSVDVPAGGQVELADVITRTFHADGSGALLVDAAESRLLVTSRTYNLLGDGSSYGQFVPGVPVEQALVNGERGHVIYAAKSDSYRTNLGWVGTTSASGQITVRLFGADGTQLGNATSFPVQPYGQRQLNDVFAQVGATATDVARAEVASTVPVVAYTSVIDNSTGDPIAVVAKHEGDVAREFAIAASAHAPGNGGATWRSDVRIWNFSAVSSAVQLTFRPRGGDQASEITKTANLAAGELREFGDVVGSLFEQANAAGSIRIKATRAQLLVTSRTYNVSSAGTFGQDIPAVPLQEALAAGDSAMFTGISGTGFRTNLGLLNLGSSDIDVEVSLAGASGVRPHATVHLRAGESQQSDALALVGATGVETGALVIRSTTPGAWYTGYASVISEGSNDAVLVPATVQRTLGSEACIELPVPATGTVAKYSVVGTTSYGTGTGTETITTQSASQTRTVDRTQFQFTVGPISTTSDTVSTLDYQILTAPAGYVSLSKVEISGSGTSAGFPFNVHTVTTFSPNWVHGPGTIWCTGSTWIMPPATQTTVMTAPASQTITTPLPAGNGEVISTSEAISTPAGAFQTVHIFRHYFASTEEQSDAAPSEEIWIDKNTGVWVKQFSYDSTGALVTTFELIELAH